MGRRRPINGLHSPDMKLRQEATRKVVNSTVQGSAADLIKVAMCNFQDWLSMSAPSDGSSGPQHSTAVVAAEAPGGSMGSGCSGGSSSLRMVGQIHDELLFECQFRHQEDIIAACKAVKQIMESVYQLNVPLIVNVSVGTKWGGMQDAGI